MLYLGFTFAFIPIHQYTSILHSAFTFSLHFHVYLHLHASLHVDAKVSSSVTMFFEFVFFNLASMLYLGRTLSFTAMRCDALMLHSTSTLPPISTLPFTSTFPFTPQSYLAGIVSVNTFNHTYHFTHTCVAHLAKRMNECVFGCTSACN